VQFQSVRLEFDESCHTTDAVQRAAYRFIDRCSPTVSRSDGNIACSLDFSDKSADQIARIVLEFKKEVLDQVLRERIRKETDSVRNFVFALAFSRTGLIDSDPKS